MTSVSPSGATTSGGSGLWCSPPDLPADTRLKRLVDRVLPRNGLGAFVFFVLVAVAISFADLFPTRLHLGVVGLASALAGGWCAVNFWRCRHAHCVVTGAGWLALAAFVAVEVVIGRSVIGGTEELVFLGVLAVSVLFELGVYAVRGTHALTREG
jgi:hypothetical protein